MKRLVKGALLAAGTALAISAAPAMSAAAAASGTETLSGTIVFAAVPGTSSRTVIGSVVRARGVFRGVGRVVELVPPDPAGVSQDDLVFRNGTMNVVSTPGALSFSVNPHSCLFTGTQQLTWRRGRWQRAVRRRDRQLHRDGQRRGAFGPQPRRQLLAYPSPAPRGGQVRGERVAVVLKRVSLPEDLRSARVIRLGEQEYLTAFSRDWGCRRTRRGWCGGCCTLSTACSPWRTSGRSSTSRTVAGPSPVTTPPWPAAGSTRAPCRRPWSGPR